MSNQFYPKGKGIKQLYSRRAAFNLAALFVMAMTVAAPLAPAFAQTADDSGSGSTSSNTASSDVPASPAPSPEITTDTTPTSDATPTPPASNSAPATDSASTPATPTPGTPPPSPPPPPSPAGAAPNQQPVGYTSFNQDQLKIDKNTGALNTTYPIDIPPGRNNLQPNVNLTYTSNDNRQGSIFGEGWSISIPYIQRINKTGTDNLYSTSSPNYFLSSLDGELATTSVISAYIARTDNGTFNKYVFSTSSNQWTMTDKNGTQYLFGSTSDSQQSDPNNSADVYKWMLKQVTDTNNNNIIYSYFKDSGQSYPSSTVYTGNGSSTGIFDVDFLRESRSDNGSSSASAFAVTSNYRINEIDVNINNSWVRKYTLQYTPGANGFTSLLGSITETGRNSSGTVVSLPTSTFSYQTATPGWTVSSTWAPPTYFNFNGTVDSDGRVADLNGDGLPDIVQGYNADTAYVNTGSGWHASSTWNPNPILDPNPPGDGGVRIADVNGDGSADVLQGWHHSPVTLQGVSINDGAGWNGLSSSTWNPPIIADNTLGYILSQVVDVNGDGFADVLTAYGDGNNNHYASYINNEHGFITPDTMWDSPAAFQGQTDDQGTRIIDLNGDGLPDITRAYAPGTGPVLYATFMNNGAGWTTLTSSSWNSPAGAYEGVSNSDQGIRFADVNGDGLPDIIQAPWNSWPTSTLVYINTGSGWVASSSWNSPLKFGNGVTDNVYGTGIADMNGDGLPDIFQAFGSNASGTPSNYVTYLNNNSIRSDILTGMTYPQGGSSTIQYAAANQLTNASGTILNTIPYTEYVVTTITNNDGLGNLSSSTYQYSGGTYYYNSSTIPFDHQFAGFSLITQTDPAGNVTKTYYHTGNGNSSSTGEYVDNFWKIGKPYRVENYDSSANLYKTTITKWDSVSLGGSAAFVFPDQTVEMDYDGIGTHKDSAETYAWSNTTGNQTQKIQYGQVSGSNDGTFSDTESDEFITNIGYASSTSSNVIGKPAIETMLNQSSTKIQETQYFYDGLGLYNISTGNLTSQKDWTTGSGYVTTTQSTYNSYGLVTQTLDPRNNTTTYTYDSYNLYPATTTNALSQSTGYQYDYSTGKVVHTTDANGNPSQTNYDGVGRPLMILNSTPFNPPVLATITTYVYTDTPNAVSVHQMDQLYSGTTVDTYSYYDGLGRVIQTRKSGETGGVYKVSDKVYNNLGLVQKESLPYFGSGSSKTSATTTPALFANYTYDPLGRTLTTGNAVGTTTNSYGNWVVTTTDPRGKTKDAYRDAYSNLIQVNEHNGSSTYSTYYTYDGLKDLTNITDALGNVRNFTYDGLGRRLTAQDLHAVGDSTYGTWNYTFDAAGNLTQQLDPNNQTTTYSYDSLNRVLTESFGGQTQIAYTYDSCTQGVGHLCVASSSAVTTSDTYDSVGNLRSEAKTIGTSTYTRSYSYGRLGNVTDITNPDNSIVHYDYGTVGLASDVTYQPSGGSASNVINNFDYAPTDQVASIAYANGVNATNTYDPTQLYRLTQKISTLPGGGGNAQNISYTYDADGNITQIVDTSNSGAGKTVNYTYDDLSRLTIASTTNVSTTPNYMQAFTYDALGNILTGPSGNYAYAGNTGSNYANPDAVTGITTSTITLPVLFDASSSSNITTNTSTYTLPLTVTSTANRVLLVSVTGMPTTVTTTAVSYNGTAMTLLMDNSNVNTRMQAWYLKNPSSGAHNVVVTMSTSSNIGLVVAADFANAMGVGTASSALSSGTSTSLSITSSNGNIVADLLNVTNRIAPAPATASGQTLLVSSSTNGSWTQGAAGYIIATSSSAINEKYNLSTSSFWQQYEIEVKGATTTAPGQVFTYDNNGNLLSSGNATNTWNYRNQITQITTAAGTSTYAYDYLGQRTQIISGGATTYYPETTYNVNTSTITKSIFANGILVATVQNTTSTGPIPVTFDASSTLNPSTVSSTFTFPLTVTSTANRVLFVSVTGMFASNTSTAASYNGSAMSLLMDNGNPNTRMQLWYLKNPASGTHNVSVTMATSTKDGIFVAADFANAVGSGATSSVLSQGTSTSVSITSANGNDVVDFLNVLNGSTSTPAAASGQLVLVSSTTVERFTQGAAGYVAALNSSAITEKYNLSTSSFWQQYEVEVVATTTPTSTATLSYVLNDSLGGTSLVTNASGSLVEAVDYYPYGSMRIDNVTGGYSGAQRKYIGQQYDGSTGLVYDNARYYNGTQGQFLSEDQLFLSIGDSSHIQTKDQNRLLVDPQSLDSYSYAKDSPITSSDPTGLTVILESTAVKGNNEAYLGAHTFFLVIPDHPSEINIAGVSANSNKFTFSGEPSGSGFPGTGNTLTKQINFDLKNAFNSSKVLNSQIISPPAGENDTQFINNLGAQYNAINLNGMGYWLGGSEALKYNGNSNDFTYTLGVHSGVGNQMDAFNPAPAGMRLTDAPGWGVVLPGQDPSNRYSFSGGENIYGESYGSIFGNSNSTAQRSN